jgi:hypothetical protein
MALSDSSLLFGIEMTHHFRWWILGFLLACASVESAENVPMRLTTEIARCKKSAAVRPSLPPERGYEGREAVRSGWYSPVVADFNGDGWCDFAWAVPYPVNSQMESYSLTDLVVLGGAKSWRQPYNGRRPALFSIDQETWPDFRVDLTEARLVFVKSGGAPFVLGLVSAYDLGQEWHASGCRQLSSVHRWDHRIDAFKRIEGAERSAVLDYYYLHVKKPCQ